MKRAKFPCGHCRHKNYLAIDQNTECNKCGKPLFRGKGLIRRAARKVLVFGGAFGAGVVFTAADISMHQGVEVFFRYPMAIEYEIIERCIRSSGGYMGLPKFFKKRDLCLCALKETQIEFNYERYQSQKKSMWRSFRNNMLGCIRH